MRNPFRKRRDITPLLVKQFGTDIAHQIIKNLDANVPIQIRKDPETGTYFVYSNAIEIVRAPWQEIWTFQSMPGFASISILNKTIRPIYLQGVYWRSVYLTLMYARDVLNKHRMRTGTVCLTYVGRDYLHSLMDRLTR